MLRKQIIAGQLVLVAGLLSLTTQASAEEVRIGAAPTENVLKKVKDAFEKSSGVTLSIIDVGPVEALKLLDAGKVDAASGGVAFADWMTMMEKAGAKVDPASYKQRVIGKDLIRVLAHKGTGVKSLSKDQLKGIFTGKITNWKEVGGADAPIVVVLGTKIPGTQSVFQKQIMDGDAYLAKPVEAGTAPEVKAKVASTPGAIGMGPKSGVDDTVAAPEMPEVGRPITLITRGAPSAGVQKLLEYINGDGKKLIEK